MLTSGAQGQAGFIGWIYLIMHIYLTNVMQI